MRTLWEVVLGVLRNGMADELNVILKFQTNKT